VGLEVTIEGIGTDIYVRRALTDVYITLWFGTTLLLTSVGMRHRWP